MKNGTEIIFLLEITWNNRIHRFSTRPIRIYDSIKEQDYQYIGTLNAPEVTLTSNFFGMNLENQSIAFQIVFDNEDLVQARFQGRVLDNAPGELSYIEINKEVKDIPNYDERTIIFKGRISQPIIGDTTKPKGHAAFSLEQGIEVDDFIIDSTTYKIPTFVSVNQGKNIPLVFGRPGKNIKYIDTSGNLEESDFSVTPGYLYQNDTTLKKVLISFGIVEATHVFITDSNGNVEPGIPVQQQRLSNTIHVISYVDIYGTALTASEEPDFKYFVSWQYTGGLNNPFGSGTLEGGADIIRYVLTFGNVDIDFQNFESVAPILNSYKFAGYINQPSQGMDFLQSEILPFLPCEITFGIKGIKITIPMLFSNLYQTPQFHIIENNDFRFFGALISQETPSEIINHIELQFAFSVMTEQHLSSITINPTNIPASNVESKTTYSDVSFNRYGLKKRVIQSNFIHDYQTAVRVSQNIIRRKALGIMTIEALAILSYGKIEIGDIIQITSTDFHLQNHNAQIIEKQYLDNQWRFTLAIEDNPIQNN